MEKRMGIKAETLLKIIQSLEKKYGTPQKPNIKIPIVDQIIIHFLSTQEKQEDIEKAYQSILKEFVDWNEIRVSHLREIQQVLQPFLKSQVSEKAHKIKDVLQQIFMLYNKIDLEALWEKDFSEIQKLAQQIPGLGQEFLLKFICYLYFQEDSPLASSFFRIGKRLSLWDENSNQTALKKNFIKEIGLEKFAHLKILLFIHGETQCLAKSYDCLNCPLCKICNRVQKDPSLQEENEEKMVQKSKKDSKELKIGTKKEKIKTKEKIQKNSNPIKDNEKMKISKRKKK